jgi:hypothetical protein
LKFIDKMQLNKMTLVAIVLCLSANFAQAGEEFNPFNLFSDFGGPSQGIRFGGANDIPRG